MSNGGEGFSNQRVRISAFVRRSLRGIRISISVLLLAAAIWFALRDVDIEKYLSALSNLSFLTFVMVGAPIALSFVMAAIRLRFIAADLGYALSFRESAAAVSSGQIGGLLLFQLVGQLVARGAYLSKLSIPMAGTVVITTNERIGAAVVSLLLAAFGAVHIFHRLSFDLNAGGANLLHVVTGMAFVFGACGFYWRHALRDVGMHINARTFIRAARSLLMSAAVQISMMVAYVVAIYSLYPMLTLTDSAAAAALVMFAASIPISFAGWGVRELSAVAALSAVGMPVELSFLSALLVGVLSVGTSFLMATFSLRRFMAPPRPMIAAPSTALLNYERFVGATIPLLIAGLVFFQVHVPIENRLFINVNLADPLALVGGLMFVAAAIARKTMQWRLTGVNAHIFACTVSITLSLMTGVLSIGWTQWAVTSKYLGWFVLLSYGASGALALANIDLHRLLRTFMIAGCAVIAFELLAYVGAALGFLPTKYLATGFAQNTNAFSFQCLMILCVSLALPARQWIGISFAVAAIWLSQSRAGLGAAVVVLTVAAVYIPGRLRPITTALVLAALCSGLISYMSNWSASCTQVGSTVCGEMLMPFAGQGTSTAEHVSLAKGAWQMFLSHPIIGGGLGVFVAQGSSAQPLAIHSTSLWLLAEFGIVGFLAFLVPALRVLLNEVRRFRANDLAGNILVLSIAGFSAMSLFHELLYQRSFWLLLGAALATQVLVPKQVEHEA